MLVIFCIQLAGSITSYTFRYYFDEPLFDKMNTTFALYNGYLNSSDTQNARRDWDILQSNVRMNELTFLCNRLYLKVAQVAYPRYFAAIFNAVLTTFTIEFYQTFDNCESFQVFTCSTGAAGS
jgi:hypothetical protein